jgi:aerobic C4-dicarboxylate transport protein
LAKAARQLMGTFYATSLIFIFVILGLIARVHGFSVWKFIKYIKEELLIVLGTSSSESVQPRMMAKMENLGARKSVVGLVIPTGYSFNLDGTSIYLTMAAVFIVQATNTPMTLTQQLTLLAVLLLTSKGTAGVTGSGFIVLAARLSAVGGVSVAGLALILGIDRFMLHGRSARVDHPDRRGVVTVALAKWTGDLDSQRMRRVLDNESASEADAPEEVLDQVEQHMPAAPTH